jgi:hypothetical protein
MKFNYQKRPYKAECIQWDGLNGQEICAMFDDAVLYGSDAIMIRHQAGVSTVRLGGWVVRGENGMVKTYSDHDFTVKYITIRER